MLNSEIMAVHRKNLYEKRKYILRGNDSFPCYKHLLTSRLQRVHHSKTSYIVDTAL